MASLNKVFLLGNLTRDPELRYTTGGSAVCAFGLAMNRRYTTARGEDREEVCFVDIETWGKQAESCNNYLRKGSPALIEGRLRLDQWDDRETGQKRSRLRVSAERVQFVGAPRGEFGVDTANTGPQQGHAGGQPAPTPPAGAPYGARPQQQPGPAPQGAQSHAPTGGESFAGQGQAPPVGGPPQPQQNPNTAPMPPFEEVNGTDDDIPF
ncbi:MAG: single-stranded DNA-binding protein [Lentisphaerae bacterium]|jgi:single-strand DNA-binding protein|nr:single-stranded DNA-binding protein [Lentisphaerota bacterium]MBT4816443.1 single-stranded DNA-binding protein [Lentisphaerota bacterium]MBT5606772.1 single-stranded DNA-binding protein [Lentisphaerota bacterium]MBT7061568.1 single-stranded DNA-binding protein [Lentisphaerota bacterium]MBT7843881.1 single-stranded DNA-binding protein [Lentisphaerota bacterium]